MRARPLLLTAGVLLVSLADLCLVGRGAIGVVDTNVPLPHASASYRIVDLVRPTAPGRVIDLSFSSNKEPPLGARVETALASAGRTRFLVVRPGHPASSLFAALRDVLAGRAALRVVPDRGWIDLGPAGDGALEMQVLGVLPGPFGLEAPLDQRTGLHGDLRIMRPAPAVDPPVRPRWRLVVPRPASPGETFARVFFFLRHSALLAAAGLLALGLFAAGAILLFSGRCWGAAVALVSSATLFHAALLPPFQGADETSHAATVEALVFRGAAPHYGDRYPRSFSLAAAALDQDRVQFHPSEPLPVGDADARARLAETLGATLAAEALERGPEAPAAGVQAADRRAALFFRAYGLAAPLLSHLAFLDRVSAYRLLASAWGLLFFAFGALLLRRAVASAGFAALYGLVALLPSSVSTMGTCSNYAPAIGLGQLLAAATCAAILTRDSPTRRLAVAVFVSGAWVGVFLWADFAIPALLGTLAVTVAAGLGLPTRAGWARPRKLLFVGIACLAATAAAMGLLRVASTGSLGQRVLSGLGRAGWRSAVFTAALAAAPVFAALLAGSLAVRLASRPPGARREALARVSVALGALAACGFLLTRWSSIPYERDWLPFPRLVGAALRAFLSDSFAWDQDRLSWKFTFGAFGWHDAFYPDVVYALARWGLVVLLVALPFLAERFLGERPREARALLFVSGGASGCAIVTLALRHLSSIVPFGRYVLPVIPLVALPLLAMIDAPGRERALRTALFAAAALQVWTALAVLGARYAFGA